MNSQPYKEWIEGIFDRSAEAYGQKYNTFFTRFAKELVKLAALPPSAQVLDIATGRGAILNEVADVIGPQGKVVGIDISSNMIQQTAQSLQHYSNIQLICMDGENLQFEDDSFDTLFCGFALFFFPNLSKALLEFLRVLKPGGKLFISTWGEDDFHAHIFHDEYKKFGFEIKPLAHNFEDTRHISEVFSQAGFTKITHTLNTLDYIYPTFQDWFKSLWAGMPRAKLERCTAEQLENLMVALQAKLAPYFKSDGLHELLRVNYTCAMKPVYSSAFS